MRYMNFYWKDGTPVRKDEWALLNERFKDMDYTVVGRDIVGDGVLVSTVWLGIDYNFRGHPPIIFETYVGSGSTGEVVERYQTLEEAQEGHRKFVEEYK